MKSNILLVMAQTGFLYDGSRSEGYNVHHPYKPCNVFQRIIREIVFRFFPFLSDLFYNKEILKGAWDSILIWDPLITRRYINFIHKSFPKAQINFIYWNMVGNARHLLPSQIPAFVHKWTYDAYDSEKYGLKLYTSYPYYNCYIRSKKETLYDVLFVGRDKGRGDFLLSLEKELSLIGLRTNFIITKSDRLSKTKSYYQKEMSYEDLCELISQSKSVLNVVMDNQKGLTLRDLEYVFQHVKLITTNQAIVDDPIYNKNNVFIIKNGDITGIKEFLELPFIDLPAEVTQHHLFDSFIDEIVHR